MKKLILFLCSALGSTPRAFCRNSSGSVTVEVAILVPLMLIILLGFSEMYLYIRAVSEVEHTAFTLADSLGQLTSVVDSDSKTNANNLGSIWADANLLASPNLLSTEGGVIITSVCDAKTTPCGTVAPSYTSTTKGTPQIYWQRQAPFPLQQSMSTTVTASNILPSTWPFRVGDSALVVEVFYYYNPFSMLGLLWADAPGVKQIYRKVYVRPRTNKPLPLVAD